MCTSGLVDVARSDATTLIREHVRAFNAGDVDALLAGFTDDAVWVTGNTVIAGRTELTGFFASAMSELSPTLTIHSLIASADLVACELVEILINNVKRHTFHIAGFYRLRDGRIAAAKIYREGSATLP